MIKVSGCVSYRTATNSNTAHSPRVVQHNSPIYCKGGSANVGVWARTEAAWPWLANTLTVVELRRLLPEAADLPITRYVLPNLHAVNFVVDGLLGLGVAYNARFDPQAKALGEWLRSRYVDVPEALL